METVLPLFRVHVSVPRGHVMVREHVDLRAPSPLAAKVQASALPQLSGAVVLKIKQLRDVPASRDGAA